MWDPSADVLWSVLNGPSHLYKLVFDENAGEFVAASGWSSPATLTFPGGGGQPDSEGVTLDSAGNVLVSTERDNLQSGISRLSVLRFDASGGSGTLEALTEWNLTATLGGQGVIAAANAGLEALTFIPDAEAVAAGLMDAEGGGLYDPAALGPHLGGVVVVGVEATGEVFLFNLFEDGSHGLLARADPGLGAIMSLEWDFESAALWAGCDNTCSNRMAVMTVDGQAGATQGQFVVAQLLDRPSGLANDNNEGLAISPSVGGERRVVWARDGGGDGQSLWMTDLPSGAPCL